MSFQYVPANLRMPAAPGFDMPKGVWRGNGRDSGYLGFSAGYNWGGNIIVQRSELFYYLKVEGSVYAPCFSDVNGYMCWEGGRSIYYTQTYGWVMSDRFPGYEPVENEEFSHDDQKYVWKGDEFYTFSEPPRGPEDEVRMEPRGALRDSGSVKILTAYWPRWVAKNGEFGIYEPVDGAEGTRELGLPRFTGNGEQFVRSLVKENGNYTYGRIRCRNGRWVIGEIDSPGGWHEGSEPDINAGVVFRFMKPEGSEAKGRDITVSFRDYVCGEETITAYLGSAAIWR